MNKKIPVLRLGPDHTEARASQYMPVGDQLDAIVSGFRAIEKAGIALPEKTVEWLNHCADIKETYRKLK